MIYLRAFLAHCMAVCVFTEYLTLPKKKKGLSFPWTHSRTTSIDKRPLHFVWNLRMFVINISASQITLSHTFMVAHKYCRWSTYARLLSTSSTAHRASSPMFAYYKYNLLHCLGLFFIPYAPSFLRMSDGLEVHVHESIFRCLRWLYSYPPDSTHLLLSSKSFILARVQSNQYHHHGACTPR